MAMPLYRELWFLGGTKLSKRAEKMLKTTLVLEDQSRQQTKVGLKFQQDACPPSDAIPSKTQMA
jgi:hypothetical protein